MPGPLPDIGDVFKDLVWDAIVKAALARLFAAIPWLGWGPVGILVSWVVGHFAEKLYGAMALAIDFRLIAYRNEQHRQAFETASVTLKIIARDQGIDSEQFQKAREAHAKALSKFVAWA